MTRGSVERAVIIANPVAGGMTGTLVSELVPRCRRWVNEVDVRWTNVRGDAARFARQAVESGQDGDPASRPSTVVLVVGGDGTVREAVAGLTAARREGMPVPVLIVPAGSANSCYRTLWGELSWQEALDAALANPVSRLRYLDLARLRENGTLVLAGACAGFPAQAIHDASKITELTGRERYTAALNRLAVSYQPYPGRVVVDGVEIHSGLTMLANVGGCRYRGWAFEVLPHTVIDDGLLDVCVIGGQHDPATMMVLARAGEHVAKPGVAYARGRQVVIERTDGRPAWFEHDGEVLLDFGDTFTFEVVPRAVPMLVGELADRGRRLASA